MGLATGFQTPLDIAKRACHHLGVREISSFIDTNSTASKILGSLYDKLRDRELTRNVWKFAVKRVILRPITGSSFIFTPSTWSSGNSYSPGAIVAYQPVAGTSWPGASGTYYWQTDAASHSNTPPDEATNWHRYAGNIVGDVWLSSASTSQFPLTTNGYFPGELVLVPATWASTTTYNAGDLVAYSDGNYYVALLGTNLNQLPNAANSTYWQLYTSWITTTGNYYPNFTVAGGGAGNTPSVYMSLTTGNTDTPGSSTKWMLMSGTVQNLEVFYPIGCGPAWDLQSMNVLRLPYGFNRIAPNYYFDNTCPYLGADITPNNDDWVIEGDYAISATQNTVMMRFVGDVIDVYDMDAMFCEGLAAEMAWNACERVTGNPDKKRDCRAAYEEYMTEARLGNAIVEGQKRQPQSEYITCRI